MMQWIFKCLLINHYIASIRVIGIGLHFLIISWKTKWINQVSSVSIITLTDVQNRAVLTFFVESVIFSLGTVNRQCWQCQSRSEYSRLLDIWLQLQKSASNDTIFIEYHMLSFGSRRTHCLVWSSISFSKIRQQDRETKYIWLVNNIMILGNKGLKMNDIMR